ncbi:33377_t:CDS:2, partial [Racocetra persica]
DSIQHQPTDTSTLDASTESSSHQDHTNDHANAHEYSEYTVEKNQEYLESIRRETAEKTPLVCSPESIENLLKEYLHGSEVYQQKIMKLAEKHHTIRRCRAFGFAWFERLLNSKDPTIHQTALETLTYTKVQLLPLWYEELIYEDMYEEVEGHLKAIVEGKYDNDKLLSIFQDESISNQIVMYLRFVTTAYLKKHFNEYEPFLDCDLEMDKYCSKYVEGMDKEADHIHVLVLTRALKIPVEIAYMSSSDALDQVNFHEFYPEEASKAFTLSLPSSVPNSISQRRLLVSKKKVGGKSDKKDKVAFKKEDDVEDKEEANSRVFDMTSITTKMTSIIGRLKKEYGAMRIGQANPAILDSVLVPHKNGSTPLRELTQITVKDPQTLLVHVYDEE